ncbi:4a-hydroxytetrahydrobiopterin dehydratase [Nocardioides halotolerans]|jgi:4a-hydroxytetrahydrobiopterin dehydratase|uniref:4a-hydroxytetrahydrobiopterin dehydratase n=1 Tax=Nocardioides halotolerans TaxID=433660 RepID=UPI000426BEB2|nr:4a-hydroxytetrahydrobiopterin dehydratase [Nocardioides halotolerans]
MTDAPTTLSENDIEQAELADWRILFTALHARFRTEDFATALKLVDKIGKAAEKADHHPEVDLSYGRVDVRLSSHDAGGVTDRDVDLARQISGFAEDVGADPAPAELSVVEVALDTPTYDDVKPFWAAVLGYETSKAHAEELNDPHGTRPTLWFQKAGEATGEVQQRFHLDVRVPPEVAEGRVRAALEAGGTLVSDTRAPTVWVLADAHGNKACITTWLGRDPNHSSEEGDAAGRIRADDGGGEREGKADQDTVGGE